MEFYIFLSNCSLLDCKNTIDFLYVDFQFSDTLLNLLINSWWWWCWYVCVLEHFLEFSLYAIMLSVKRVVLSSFQTVCFLLLFLPLFQ